MLARRAAPLPACAHTTLYLAWRRAKAGAYGVTRGLRGQIKRKQISAKTAVTQPTAALVCLLLLRLRCWRRATLPPLAFSPVSAAFLHHPCADMRNAAYGALSWLPPVFAANHFRVAAPPAITADCHSCDRVLTRLTRRRAPACILLPVTLHQPPVAAQPSLSPS